MNDAATDAGDEAHLVALASSGDVAAFQQLYEQNVGTVFGFLCNRVGHQAAEDLTAETFCRAYERIGSYEHRGAPFRAWLLRIAFHLVVGAARRKSSTDVLVGDPRPVPTAGDVAAEVVARIESEDVVASMAQLSEAHRTVLELRYLRDLSVGETAVVLDSNEEAVRALTYRALRALRAIHPGRERGD